MIQHQSGPLDLTVRNELPHLLQEELLIFRIDVEKQRFFHPPYFPKEGFSFDEEYDLQLAQLRVCFELPHCQNILPGDPSGLVAAVFLLRDIEMPLLNCQVVERVQPRGKIYFDLVHD